MLGELLYEPHRRRSALLVLCVVLLLGVTLSGVGAMVPGVEILLPLGLGVISLGVLLVAKVVLASHVHLRGTAARLIALNDRYDETERWLELFDRDTRESFVASRRADESNLAGIRGVETSVAAIGARLDGAASALRGEVERLTKTLAAESSLGEARERSGRERVEKAEAGLQRLTASLDGVSKSASERAVAQGAELTALKTALSGAVARVEAAAASVKDLRGELAKVNDEHERKRKSATHAVRVEAQSALDETKKSLDERHESTLKRLDEMRSLTGRLRGDPYTRFSRLVSAEAEAGLRDLGAKPVASELRYLERKLQVIEGLCEGRLAGSADDAVARVFASRMVRRKELRVLEIGVLFGVGAIYMHEALAPHFGRVRLTLLDPFDGYYGPDHVDPTTGQPITRGAVERNLRRTGVPSDDVMFVEGLSTDDTARTQVAEAGPYDVVLIDGDHSREGITADFTRYSEMVRDGGVLIVDDYGSPDWPDVTAYTDGVIAADERFKRVAVIGKTAIFKRARSGKGAARAAAARGDSAMPDAPAEVVAGSPEAAVEAPASPVVEVVVTPVGGSESRDGRVKAKGRASSGSKR